MHKYRSEHWVVVQGIAEIEVDNKKFTLYPNQSTYIPVGSKHNLCQPGKIFIYSRNSKWNISWRR